MSPVPPQFAAQSERNAQTAAERRRSIIERLKTGESQTAIAQSLGVTRNVIWRIAQRAKRDGQL